MNVLARRFCNQRLVASRLRAPVALVSWMGAVQGSLDVKARARGADIICRALEGHRYLTRKELATCLKAARLPSAGQHLASLVMHAELEGLICDVQSAR